VRGPNAHRVTRVTAYRFCAIVLCYKRCPQPGIADANRKCDNQRACLLHAGYPFLRVVGQLAEQVEQSPL